MQEPATNRQWGRVEVSAGEFQNRMNQLSTESQTLDGYPKTASVLSRLALVHQAAKAFALADLHTTEPSRIDLSIEELTDPPLYDSENTDSKVIIQYSYLPAEGAG